MYSNFIFSFKTFSKFDQFIFAKFYLTQNFSRFRLFQQYDKISKSKNVKMSNPFIKIHEYRSKQYFYFSVIWINTAQ